MASFAWDKTQFSRKFKKAKNVQQFMSVWNRNVAPFVDPSTGRFHPSQKNASSLTPNTSKESTSTPQERTVKRKETTTPPAMLLPNSKKSKQDDGSDDSKVDKSIEKCYAGIVHDRV